MCTQKDDVRFTLVLPVGVAQALDAWRDQQEARAGSVVGARVRLGRSSAVTALLRKALGVDAAGR
ncbi:MAG: hypothetical protein KJN79_09405 [Gammaproteobacteria bacterium]|nr:hypothetical protein [Gammaproteobacteria bacterium]